MRATAHPSPNTHSVTSSWQLEICCDGVLTLCMCAMCVVGHFSSVWLFVTPWTVAYQVPLSTEFSRQELKRVTMPSSRGSSQPRDWTHISLLFLALAGQFFTTSTTWEAFYTIVVVQWLSCNWLWPHGQQHARLLCPSYSPRVCSSSCPLSQWCHPIISSSVSPFSFCPQFFPAPGSFPMNLLFTSGDQSIGASALVLPMNIQGWIPLRLTGLISLLSQGLQASFPAPQFRSFNSCVLSLLYGSTLTPIHDHWKNHSSYYRDLCQQSDASAF